MFFALAFLIMLNLSALLAWPLIPVALLADVLAWRYLSRRATRHQQREAEARYEDMLALWSRR